VDPRHCFFKCRRGPPDKGANIVSYHYEAESVGIVSYIIVEEQDSGDFPLTVKLYRALPLLYRRIIHAFYLGRQIGRGLSNDFSLNYHKEMSECTPEDLALVFKELQLNGFQYSEEFLDRVSCELAVSSASLLSMMEADSRFVFKGDMVRAFFLDPSASVRSSIPFFPGFSLEDLRMSWDHRPASLLGYSFDDYTDVYDVLCGEVT